MPQHQGEPDESELALPSDHEERVAPPARGRWDDAGDDVDDRSTYPAATHGPAPAPAWLLTSGEATQLELGPLKSGKEATVSLVERRLGEDRNLLAAKRYRAFEDRMFRDDARYRQGRRTGSRRVDLAARQGTRHGMAFRAQQWIRTEFDTLGRLWSAGVAVPYPVQLLGNELLLEYLGDDEGAAPRLVDVRPTPAEGEDLLAQFAVLVRGMGRAGVVHADLSPFNLLVWQGRLHVIDFPQAVDPYTNPDGLGLLHHDVTTVCTWFERRGIECDGEALYADVLVETLR